MRTYIDKFLLIVWCLISLICFASCFSEVEMTKKITEKDVLKLGVNDNTSIHTEIDTIRGLLFSDWQKGKPFYITDNQIGIIFRSNNNINLQEGKILQYDSYFEENIYGNNPNICLIFKDVDNNKYVYNTSKTLNELNDLHKPLVIPFLIDMDVVTRADEILKGKDLYLNNSVWYNKNEEVITGVKFVKVKILSVQPGNEIYSLKVKFKYDKYTSSVFVSTLDDSVSDRTFDNLFSLNDPHDKYPNISDENWILIQKGRIVDGMTKDECRLSLGAPTNIERIPTYNGLKELWQYDDGKYLVFMDGLLVNYRK